MHKESMGMGVFILLCAVWLVVVLSMIQLGMHIGRKQAIHAALTPGTPEHTELAEQLGKEAARRNGVRYIGDEPMASGRVGCGECHIARVR